MRLIQWLMLLAVLALAAGGCASPASEPTRVGEVSVVKETTPAAASPMGQIDYSCRTDADCAIKDVGNCCGYYPACVNTNSPTFAEQVRAECAREGTAGVCGFPTINRCQCVASRCEAAASDANALPLD